jgi:hypothetical protein
MKLVEYLDWIPISGLVAHINGFGTIQTNDSVSSIIGISSTKMVRKIAITGTVFYARTSISREEDQYAIVIMINFLKLVDYVMHNMLGQESD